MNGLDVVIKELQGANSDLEQSNDAAERRDFFRKYPHLTERDFLRHKASEAMIRSYYAQPVEVINADMTAQADENRLTGLAND